MNINTKKMQVFKRQEGVPLNPEKIKQTFLIWPLILGDLSKLGRFIKKKTFFGQRNSQVYLPHFFLRFELYGAVLKKVLKFK